MNEWKTLATAAAAVLVWTSGSAVAADAKAAPATTPHTTAAQRDANRGDARDEARGAVKDVQKAADVLRKMEASTEGAKLLDQAKGVFVVPEFGGAALGLGARGGVGVLMVRNGTSWSDPAFYNFGTVSFGAQAGAEGGSFVLVLNTQKAVDSFLQANNWSLDANAGLTIVNWSTKGQGSAGLGDVTMWSNSKGLYAGATIGVTDIKYDRDQTSAFYGRQQIAAADVVKGEVHGGKATALHDVLRGAGTTAAAASPSSTDHQGAAPGVNATGRGSTQAAQTRP